MAVDRLVSNGRHCRGYRNGLEQSNELETMYFGQGIEELQLSVNLVCVGIRAGHVVALCTVRPGRLEISIISQSYYLREFILFFRN